MTNAIANSNQALVRERLELRPIVLYPSPRVESRRRIGGPDDRATDELASINWIAIRAPSVTGNEKIFRLLILVGRMILGKAQALSARPVREVCV